MAHLSDQFSTSDDARRRRIRWRVAGLLLVALGTIGLVAGGLAERSAWDRFGTGELDAALSRESRLLDATIMSSDPWDGGWLVSYEYYFGSTLEVGYQRIPADQGRRLGFGSVVRIEAVEHAVEGARFPASSRLAGTVREPHAWITQTLDGTHGLRLGIGGVVLGLGILAILRPPGRS
ncbi:MAG: hypothetical protein R3F61_07105 [Myxococcota bacterium]